MSTGDMIFCGGVVIVLIIISIRLMLRRSVKSSFTWPRGDNPQKTAQTILKLLEQARGFHPDVRRELVVSVIRDVVDENDFPDIQMKHAEPENFEELVSLIKTKAYPETIE